MFLVLAIIVFIFVGAGFKYKSTKYARLRSWLAVMISALLTIVLFLSFCLSLLFSNVKDYLLTTTSPDQTYQIDFYYNDAGAKGTFGITGELKGPFWFKKLIYHERRVHDVEVEWENDHTILVNGHKLDVRRGDTLSK